MTVQPRLCWTWSETPKTGFLTTQLISFQAFDRLLQRNEKLHSAIRDKVEKEDENIGDISDIPNADISDISGIKSELDIKAEPEDAQGSEVKVEPKVDDSGTEAKVKEEQSEVKTETGQWCELLHEKTCLSGFPTRSDTNRAVQPQKLARGLKF